MIPSPWFGEVSADALFQCLPLCRCRCIVGSVSHFDSNLTGISSYAMQPQWAHWTFPVLLKIAQNLVFCFSTDCKTKKHKMNKRCILIKKGHRPMDVCTQQCICCLQAYSCESIHSWLECGPPQTYNNKTAQWCRYLHHRLNNHPGLGIWEEVRCSLWVHSLFGTWCGSIFTIIAISHSLSFLFSIVNQSKTNNNNGHSSSKYVRELMNLMWTILIPGPCSDFSF